VHRLAFDSPRVSHKTLHPGKTFKGIEIDDDFEMHSSLNWYEIFSGDLRLRN